MVFNSPDPDNSFNELTSPARHDLMMQGPQAEDSEEEQHDHFGYQLLAQGEAVHSDNDSEVEEVRPPVLGVRVYPTEITFANFSQDLHSVERLGAVLNRDIWNSQRSVDPIELNGEIAQQAGRRRRRAVSPEVTIENFSRDLRSVQRLGAILNREVWNSQRSIDPIEMNSEIAQQVVTAMANISIPPLAIPEWARHMTDEEWTQTLNSTLQRSTESRGSSD